MLPVAAEGGCRARSGGPGGRDDRQRAGRDGPRQGGAILQDDSEVTLQGGAQHGVLVGVGQRRGLAGPAGGAAPAQRRAGRVLPQGAGELRSLGPLSTFLRAGIDSSLAARSMTMPRPTLPVSIAPRTTMTKRRCRQAS